MKFRPRRAVGPEWRHRRSAHRFVPADHFAESGIGAGATQLVPCVLPKKQKNAIKFDA
jgi:hypothetical protein